MKTKPEPSRLMLAAAERFNLRSATEEAQGREFQRNKAMLAQQREFNQMCMALDKAIERDVEVTIFWNRSVSQTGKIYRRPSGLYFWQASRSRIYGCYRIEIGGVVEYLKREVPSDGK